MKLPSIQYQDNGGKLAKRDIYAPQKVANAQAQAVDAGARAAGAAAGAASQEAAGARAMAQLYGNAADTVTKIEDHFLDQEATRQVQEAESQQKLALHQLRITQDQMDEETGLPAWQSLDNYKSKQQKILEGVTENMNGRARMEFDPKAQVVNDGNLMAHTTQAEAWRKDDVTARSNETRRVEIESKEFGKASETNQRAYDEGVYGLAQYNKNQLEIDQTSTIDSHVDVVGKDLVDTGNVKALTEHKKMVAEDPTLTPRQRVSSVAKIEEMQINKYLENYHNSIQAEEKATNLDVAVKKGRDRLNEVIRMTPEELGGDDKFRSSLHSMLRTELGRYEAQLAARNKVSKQSNILMAPLQLSAGDSSAAGKVGEKKNNAYMTDPKTGQQMSQADWVANKPSPVDGKTPMHAVTGYITAQNGHLPKTTVDTLEGQVRGSVQEQVAALEALDNTLSYSGVQGNRNLKHSKLSPAVVDRYSIGQTEGYQRASELVTQYEKNPEAINKQFSSGEAKKAFDDTWTKNSAGIIGDVLKTKNTFIDTKYNISTVDQGRIKEIAKRLYPIVQNPESAIKAATEQVLAAGEYLKDNTTGTPTFSRKANSITNIEGFDSLSETDQAVAGQQAYDAVIIDNGGVEPDRTKIIYTTDPASSPNKPIFRATYINRFGTYTQSGQMSVDKKSLPDTAVEMEDIRVRNAQVKRAQTQKNLVDGALETEKTGQQLDVQQKAALDEEEGKGKMSNTAYWGIKANEAGKYASDRLSIGLDFFGDLISLPAKAKNDYYEMRREQERNNAAK